MALRMAVGPARAFVPMFGNLGFSETVVIGAIALVILGPRRLPEVARTLGRTLARFRGAANELRDTVEREVGMAEAREALTEASRGLSACDDTDRQTAQTSVGALTQYRCLYRARLTYTATLITNPTPNKPAKTTRVGG